MLLQSKSLLSTKSGASGRVGRVPSALETAPWGSWAQQVHRTRALRSASPAGSLWAWTERPPHGSCFSARDVRLMM